MKSRLRRLGFHEIQVPGGLDFMKFRFPGLGFHEIQVPEAWISSNSASRRLRDFGKSKSQEGPSSVVRGMSNAYTSTIHSLIVFQC